MRALEGQAALPLFEDEDVCGDCRFGHPCGQEGWRLCTKVGDGGRSSVVPACGHACGLFERDPIGCPHSEREVRMGPGQESAKTFCGLMGMWTNCAGTGRCTA